MFLRAYVETILQKLKPQCQEKVWKTLFLLFYFFDIELVNIFDLLV